MRQLCRRIREIAATLSDMAGSRTPAYLNGIPPRYHTANKRGATFLAHAHARGCMSHVAAESRPCAANQALRAAAVSRQHHRPEPTSNIQALLTTNLHRRNVFPTCLPAGRPPFGRRADGFDARPHQPHAVGQQLRLGRRGQWPRPRLRLPLLRHEGLEKLPEPGRLGKR